MTPEYLVLAGIAVMLLLALGIVFFMVLYQRRAMTHYEEVEMLRAKRQHELLEASIQAGDAERRRLAAELHDDVGATLSSVRLFLRTTGGKAPETDIVEKARELLDEGIGKVRSLSHRLQPALLERLGLEAALKSLANTLTASGVLTVQLITADMAPELGTPEALAVYRMVQELVTNITKHSGATLIEILLGGGSDWRVELRHDGHGLMQQEFESQLDKPGAIGLKNLQARAELLSASLQFEREEGGRYRVSIGAGEAR
jgi:signal transduction histidine kinase